MMMIIIIIIIIIVVVVVNITSYPSTHLFSSKHGVTSWHSIFKERRQMCKVRLILCYLLYLHT